MAYHVNFCVLFLATTVTLLQTVPRIVDLSYKQNRDSMTWPGNPSYNFTQLFRGYFELPKSGIRPPSPGKTYFILHPSSWIENNHFAMPEHMGTHIDAPVHTVQGMWKTDQIPMENLYGAGVIINVKSKAATNPDYRVTVEDLLMWEEKYGEMPRRAVAIMNSGWSSKYPNKTLVFGSPEPTDISTLHFPSWHEDACTWLINKRQINAVGVDTHSTDYGMTSTFPCHTILGKNRVVGIENVANLDNVPESGSTIYIPVLNIADGSGGPARVFATYDDEPNKTNAAALVTCFTFYLYTLAAVLACNVL